jgi:hypothetical protein
MNAWEDRCSTAGAHSVVEHLLDPNSSFDTVTPITPGVIRNDPETVELTGIYRNPIRHWAEV